MIDVKDIIVNTDIEFVNGDLNISESDAQHVEHILKASAGQFYQWPTLGVGVDANIKGSMNKVLLKQKIETNLTFDDYKVNKVEIGGEQDSFTIAIDAKRLK